MPTTSTQTQGLQLARSMGWLMAAELRAHGVDLSFAPCVDLDYGISEVIGDRAFHSRPEAVAELALAYVAGMKDAGMAATAKHFPGHGAVIADSHKSLPVDRRGWNELGDDLLPYRRLIANGLPGVMVAHVLFPPSRPEPASLSRRWVQNALREELRFEGAIFTDDLSMGGAAEYGDIVARAFRGARGRLRRAAGVQRPRSVAQLLDRLRWDPQPSSHLRLVRMRGKAAPEREELVAGDAWRASQELLARSDRRAQAQPHRGQRMNVSRTTSCAARSTWHPMAS
jgi:beta-N-acetylhexosaminidase